jgi:hypothetical protein
MKNHPSMRDITSVIEYTQSLVIPDFTPYPETTLTDWYGWLYSVAGLIT